MEFVVELNIYDIFKKYKVIGDVVVGIIFEMMNDM